MIADKIQELAIVVQRWPTILDYDIAGEVHAIGPRVEKFKEGDRTVACIVPNSTCFALC